MADSWTVADFMDALVATLRGRPALAGVTVAEAWPGGDDALDLNEVMWFGDARTVDKDIATARAGTKRRSETYELLLIAECRKPGGTANDARRRALALAREAEKALAENPRQGQPVDSARVSGQTLKAEPTDDGWWSAVDTTITVSARIL